MWFTGSKSINATEAWFFKGKAKKNLQWHRPSVPAGSHAFSAAGFAHGLKFSPSEFLMWSLRCSAVLSKSVSISLASYYNTLAVFTQVYGKSPNFVLKPEAKLWKDFVGSANTGRMGACLSAMYMDACGFSWFGHWEDVFKSQPSGAAPDFVFTDKVALSLCEAKGTTSHSNHNPKNGWRDQVHPRLIASPLITDGTCLSVLMPHGLPASISIATNRSQSPKTASTSSISAAIASHYSGLARLSGMDQLHAAIERRISDKDVAINNEGMKILAIGGRRYVYGRAIKIHPGRTLICAVPVYHAGELFKYAEVLQRDHIEINADKEPQLYRPMWSHEMHNFSDGTMFLISEYEPRWVRSVRWDSYRQEFVANAG